MHVEYQGKGLTITDDVRSFADKKIAKVMKFLEEPIEARATFEADKHHKLVVDLHLAHRHGLIQAEEAGASSPQDAINSVVAKAEKQARRARKKFMDVRRRADRNVWPATHWEVEVLDGKSVGRGDTPRVVKAHDLEIKPMTVDEAVLALEGAKNDFVVFRHAETDQVNVLYRRRDGDFGLIVPEL